MHDGFQMHVLGRHQRKSGGKIESQLAAEQAARAGPGPVRFAQPVVVNVSEKIEILAQRGAS
jgi:hypothetical protein